jgi:hypothetical protein
VRPESVVFNAPFLYKHLSFLQGKKDLNIHVSTDKQLCAISFSHPQHQDFSKSFVCSNCVSRQVVFLTAWFIPAGIIFDHCIEDNHKLPHAGSNGNFVFLPRADQPVIKGFYLGVVTNA